LGWGDGRDRHDVNGGGLLCDGADLADYKKQPKPERCKKKIFHGVKSHWPGEHGR
jgi:hypothetical protein